MSSKAYPITKRNDCLKMNPSICRSSHSSVGVSPDKCSTLPLAHIRVIARFQACLEGKKRNETEEDICQEKTSWNWILSLEFSVCTKSKIYQKMRFWRMAYLGVVRVHVCRNVCIAALLTITHIVMQNNYHDVDEKITPFQLQLDRSVWIEVFWIWQR